MSKTTLYRSNNDRIVIQSYGQRWQIIYYAAAPVRRHWLRRLLAGSVLFKQRVGSVAEIHNLLRQKGMHLSRAEAQRLHRMLMTQSRLDRVASLHPA